MNRIHEARPAFAERVFTLGSASLFLALMGAVAWALAAFNAFLK
ncbi:MAG TPA: hypothetical protein VGF71_15020 [Caulobacteraceae bacterium]|jgi:hypothetical protein